MIRKFPDIKDLKLTEKLIFRIVYQHGPVTKNEILSYTEGSLSTVQRMLNNLVKENIIIEADPKGATGGRKPVSYAVNPHAYYALGAYMTWDVYGIGLSAIDGTILANKEMEIRDGLKPSDVTVFYNDAINGFLEARNIDRSHVLGISFASTGPLLKEKGILYHPHHLVLPHWDVVPIKDMIEMSTGLEVAINNLASAAILGELMNNSMGTVNRAAYILIDVGVGTDVFIPGMMDLNKDDSSGNLGHMIIDLNGEPCICGNRGCLETFISIESLGKKFKAVFPDAYEEQRKKCRRGGETSPWESSVELCGIRHIMKDTPAGESGLAGALAEELSDALGAGIRNFINLTRPSVVFLGGRVATQLPEIIERSLEKVKVNPYLDMFNKIDFKHSNFSRDLLIRGGAYHVFDNYMGLIRPVSL